MNILIDKNYLLGASAESIKKLQIEHRLLMSETLFLEILSADDKSHIKKCFSKFPQKENPIDLLPSSGNLIFFEKTKHECCSPIENRILDIRYEFNSNLRGDKYEIIIKHAEKPIGEWKKKSSEGASGFLEKASTVCGWFPGLKDKEKITIEEKELAIKKAAEDSDFIRNVYAKIQKGILEKENEQWPLPEKINKNWALFRYFQFHLMGTIEVFWRHTQNDKKIMNTYLDMDYCILGSLVDGLLTRDNIMASFYKMACPEKILLN